MMRVPVEIKQSPIHGYGLFASQKILVKTVVWSFSRIFDHVVPQYVYARCEKGEQQRLFTRGFKNPHNTEEMVMCGDEAQFMNFPLLEHEPNVIIGGTIDGFDILVAARDIVPGEELLVSPESDLDYHVKILGYGVTERQDQAG